MSASAVRVGGAERLPALLFGGWEAGLLVFMALLYLAGFYINPRFFGSASALFAVLRDASVFGVLAVGATFVIVNRELDLSIGSTAGLSATVFAVAFATSRFDLGPTASVLCCLALGIIVGLVNGMLVTVLQVPAFIATLTMLFIGRGLVIGLTGGDNIGVAAKAAHYPALFALGDTNRFGFNNQIVIFVVVAAIGAIVLAYTTIGWTTYATGGNEQAARYAGIATRFVRMRSYLISSVCAAIGGLMLALQNKGVDSSYGLGAELIAIAAVIVGGASIAGGRGRMLGSCIGVLFVELVDKVLREGVPITRVIDVGGERIEVAAVAQLPPGAVPAALGLILVVAVLIEPWLVRRRAAARLWARLCGRPAPPVPEIGGIAMIGVQTRGSVVQDRGLQAHGVMAFLHRRDAAAILLAIALWLFGMWARPDFWGGLDNSFTILLAFSEVALLAVGMTFVMAAGDIDLSVGSVLAFSGATAAFLMHESGMAPLASVAIALVMGTLMGVVNGWLTTRMRMPAFIATLGMFYIARGLGATIVAGRQLSGFPEQFNLIGRNVYELLNALGVPPQGGFALALARAISVQTIFVAIVAVAAGVVLAYTPYGQKIYAVGGNERAAGYAGINTGRVRFSALVFSAICASCAGIIYIAFYRSFNPSAGQLRELDAIASVIIGGGSVFGGYGTMLGSLAGAMVITLIRTLLSLQIRFSDGSVYVLPPQWLNVFIGGILIIAVVSDIWLRQNNILGRWRTGRRPPPAAGELVAGESA
jgi:ribose transport system permease protein